MSYCSNPHAPKARRAAVNEVVRDGSSVVDVARRYGVHRTTVHRWIKKARELDLRWNANIPTFSSAPIKNAKSLPKETVKAIIDERRRSGRGAYFIHLELLEQGYEVSLSSVKRTLRREGLTKSRSKWARCRPHVPRPRAEAPGDLVQIDTIHFHWVDGTRFYVYTLIDLYSRAAYAEYSKRINQVNSLAFTLRGRDYLGIEFKTVQTDNGSEFGKWFNDQLKAKGITLRHSRVRKSNDNAHIERFNRTIQEEMLPRSVLEEKVPEKIWQYLIYYNQFRRHSAIDGGYPLDLLEWLE